MFVEIPARFLRRIATDSDRIPTLYYSRYWAVRRFFWMRLRMIYALLRRLQRDRSSCLDFGGGGGVFLPTLASSFKQVVCIDLENAEAAKVVAHYRLANVALETGDISVVRLEHAPFDAIIAADVLEHFEDLSVPVDALKRWLKSDGMLYTSLPTETKFYAMLRKVFGIVKPADHYHSAEEVEHYLTLRGFKRVATRYVPLHRRLLPLFAVSAWKAG